MFRQSGLQYRFHGLSDDSSRAFAQRFAGVRPEKLDSPRKLLYLFSCWRISYGSEYPGF